MGAGLSFTYAAGIPVPTFLEFEAGFAGCSYSFASQGDAFNEAFNAWFTGAVEDTLGGAAAASALGGARGGVNRTAGERRPGLNAATLARLHELHAHPGGGGADGSGFDIDYRVGKVLGRRPTKAELAAVARRLRDEKAALGDAVAAEAEATRLQQQEQLRDPAAEAAAAAALGRPAFNGPYCSSDDPYGWAVQVDSIKTRVESAPGLSS
jgi:hypothetical protein